MPPADGLDTMQAKRATRTRSEQRLPPKRENPGRSSSGVDTRFTVAVENLAHNPDNARETYSEGAITEMADSLEDFGQLQDLVVVSRGVWLQQRPQDEEAIGAAYYVVNIGNRRLAAAQRNKLPRLNVWVRDDLGADGDQFDEAMLIENIHRAALDPLLEAKALDRMITKKGSLRKAAKAIGKSHGYVQQRRGLLQLIPELRGALKDGELGFRNARILSALDADTQRQVWDAGSPFAPPEKASDHPTESAVDGDTAVNQVYSPEGAVLPEEVDLDEAAPASKPKGRQTPSTPQLVIRVAPHSPEELATAIRTQLAEHELAELVRLLGQ